jgi:hypothetical protein
VFSFLARGFAWFGMQLEVVSFEGLLFIKRFKAILAGIARMDLAVMLFLLNFAIKDFPTFFTSIFGLIHIVCSSQKLIQNQKT